jgi:hypothetical protein
MRANIIISETVESFFEFELNYEPGTIGYFEAKDLQVIKWSGENLDQENLLVDDESLSEAKMVIEKHLRTIYRCNNVVVWCE